MLHHTSPNKSHTKIYEEGYDHEFVLQHTEVIKYAGGN